MSGLWDHFNTTYSLNVNTTINEIDTIGFTTGCSVGVKTVWCGSLENRQLLACLLTLWAIYSPMSQNTEMILFSASSLDEMAGILNSAVCTLVCKTLKMEHHIFKHFGVRLNYFFFPTCWDEMDTLFRVTRPHMLSFPFWDANSLI